MRNLLSLVIDNKKLATLFSKDWLLKFVSLVLAVILWSFVGGEDRIDKNVMVPIEIINLPRDLVISNQFKKEIEVTVSGPRSIIMEMVTKAESRQVDLSTATPGTMVIENDNDHIPVPRGISVQRVQPASIILSLDKLIQKQFPVSARTVGKVAAGYFIQSLKTDPDVITITGPQTTLTQFDELFTKVINLTDVKQSAQLQVPLELEPAIVELIGETSVTADLTIGLETVTKTMVDMKVHVVLDGTLREVQPPTVRITANIPKMLLTDKNDPENLFSVTAMQHEGEDRLRVTVIPRADVELPIEIISIIPGEVSLVTDNSLPVIENSENETATTSGVSTIAPPVTMEYAPEEDTPIEEAVEESVEAENAQPIVILRNSKKKRRIAEQ